MTEDSLWVITHIWLAVFILSRTPYEGGFALVMVIIFGSGAWVIE